MNPFLIITVFLLLSVALEKLFPRVELPYKRGWIIRAVLLNLLQLIVVLVGSATWEVWLSGRSLFILPWSPFYNGLFAYAVNAWVFYWWHYARHENNFCWNLIHQVHHSPERLETITSFYKHPVEIIINSLIISVLTRPILGLNNDTNAWLTIFSALAEFFYHINISTPYWLGYIIQRPENHLAHHERDRQFTCNHGDIPIFDILNGTFWNVTKEEEKRLRTGFSGEREELLGSMLLGQNVLKERPKHLPKNLFQCFLISCLFLLGILNVSGLVFNSNPMRGLAIVSTASPLPFVFSAYEGIETFSTRFNLHATIQNQTFVIPVNHHLTSKLEGPYNWRNVIGSVFSHGPFFQDPKLIQMRDQILNWGFCQGHLVNEFLGGQQIQNLTIEVRSRTKGLETQFWTMKVVC